MTVILTPKFIYFDLDDTLLDHRQAERAALRDLHRRFNWFNGTGHQSLVDVYHDINRDLWEQYGKGEIERSTLQRLRFENTLTRLGLDGSLYEEAGNFYMQAYRDHWRWIHGALDAFEKINKKFGTGILTNGFAETQKKKIELFELQNYAQHLVISEEVGYLKPQPEIFEYATSLTKDRPEDILYIGDSYSSDIIGGASYGWKTAWYTDGAARDEAGMADFVFSDFKDLCNFLNV